MNKTKYIPFSIIAVLVLATLVYLSNRSDSKLNTDIVPSPIPVSEVDLDDKSSAQVAIDAELNQMDKELGGIKDSDFDSSGLSDDQLGL